MNTASPHTVAIVSDATGRTDDPNLSPPDRAHDRLSRLNSIAALLHHHTNLETQTMVLDPDGSQELCAQLTDLSTKFTTIYLIDTTWERAHAARKALGRTRRVITDWQTSAIALTAALLTTLTRLHRSAHSSTVLIVSCERQPEIAALAGMAGFGDITSWTPPDAPSYPLSALARNATVIINAVNSTSIHAQLTRMILPPPIITLNNPEQSLLALTELLLPGRDPWLPDAHLAYACARGLSGRTPPDRLLPRLEPSAP